MAEYICPDKQMSCGLDPAQWCNGCQCPQALAAEDAFDAWWQAQPVGEFSGVSAKHVRDAYSAGMAAQRAQWSAAFEAARDAVLNGRGPLEGEGLQSDQTNAVLDVLDDAFTGLV